MLLDNHQPSVSRRLFSKTTVNHQQYCMLIIVVPYRMTTISYADKCQAPLEGKNGSCLKIMTRPLPNEMCERFLTLPKKINYHRAVQSLAV